MTRQARTALVLGVAVVTASAATYGVYRAISSIPVRTVEIATNYAIVAAKDLPTGTLLKEQDVKRVAWPAKTPLPNGFTEVDKVVDRGLISNVVENEPIVESKLAPKEAGGGLPPSIPEGMRAMSVKVNEVIGVAGFVVPGNRVDVMVTIKQNNESITKTVLSNVQVLTAGTRIEQQNAKDNKPIPSTVITLLVSPPDGEKIALAQSEGQLMLALRNPLDVAPTVTSGARTANLLAGTNAPVASSGPAKSPVRRAAAPVVQAPAPPPPPSAYTVEAIRAAKRTEEVVR